ncbi:hypothetical protein [Oscillibacter sp.]|uniref:hypothetical protein n=1 Tax=Oscillibacter sp. TaxID=1945593 RepID=UPI0033933460
MKSQGTISQAFSASHKRANRREANLASRRTTNSLALSRVLLPVFLILTLTVLPIRLVLALLVRLVLLAVIALIVFTVLGHAAHLPSVH